MDTTAKSGNAQSEAQHFGNYERERETLVADLKNVASDADQLAKTAMASSTEVLSAGRQKLAGKLSEMRMRVEDAQIAAAERVRRAADLTRTYVAENPRRSIGVAAVAGLIMGFLLSRRP